MRNSIVKQLDNKGLHAQNKLEMRKVELIIKLYLLYIYNQILH